MQHRQQQQQQQQRTKCPFRMNNKTVVHHNNSCCDNSISHCHYYYYSNKRNTTRNSRKKKNIIRQYIIVLLSCSGCIIVLLYNFYYYYMNDYRIHNDVNDDSNHFVIQLLFQQQKQQRHLPLLLYFNSWTSMTTTSSTNTSATTAVHDNNDDGDVTRSITNSKNSNIKSTKYSNRTNTDTNQQEQSESIQTQSNHSNKNNKSQDYTKNESKTNNKFAACIMVRNDPNDIHLLYEWIAYHYTTISLRYIVIGLDDNNSNNNNDEDVNSMGNTDSNNNNNRTRYIYNKIIHRWSTSPLPSIINSTTTNTNQSKVVVFEPIQFWILHSKDFNNRHSYYNNKYSTTTTNNTTTKQTNKDDYHHALIARQKGFITSCTELLQSKKQQSDGTYHDIGWTLYIDTDEFIVWNPLPETEEVAQQQFQSNIHTTEKYVDVLSGKQQDITTISSRSNEIRKNFTQLRNRNNNNNPNFSNIIHQLQEQEDIPNECYTIPRLLIGALENRTCPNRYNVTSVHDIAKQILQSPKIYQQPQSTYSYDQMSTIRYYQHATIGDFAKSKFGKVMMDISKLNTSIVQQQVPKNIHRPYKEYCVSAGSIQFIPSYTYFYIAHYIGSYERYNSRSSYDVRRNRLEWEYRAYVDSENKNNNNSTIMATCNSMIHNWFVQFQELIGHDEHVKYLFGYDDMQNK